MSLPGAEGSSSRLDLKPSRYNIFAPLPDGAAAVYNRRLGSCISFSGNVWPQIERFLASDAPNLSFLGDDENRAVKLASNLVTGGFVVPRDFDELAAIRARYDESCRNPNLWLTVYPTYACNLGCDYCVVRKKNGTMSREVEDTLLDFVGDRLRSARVPHMLVEWFGGEPLLAVKPIERLSTGFLRLCDHHGTQYRAQLVTNGTLIAHELPARIASWGIDRIQVTLDGARATHDARRGWKNARRSSFDDIMHALHRLVGRFAIRVRVNVDRRNIHEVSDLLRLFAEEGWLEAGARFHPYVARVVDFTDACAWVVDVKCRSSDLEDVESQWLAELHARGVPVLMQPLYGFPEPRSATCGAVQANAFTITPDGSLHKCDFDADEGRRAVGNLGQTLDPCNEDLQFWREHDPFGRPECVACEALPSCLGFCPRNRRDGREQHVNENCDHFRREEVKAVARHVELQRRSATSA